MATELIHDRGRGPEVVGTRTTVYNLIPYFLDPAATEDYICRVSELTPEQVAAARAYVLANAEAVLSEHVKIESRISVGNPPQVAEEAKATHARFLDFRKWLAERQAAADKQAPKASENLATNADAFPTFHEWLADRK